MTATPQELRATLEAVHALYAVEGFSARVREALESLEQSLAESITANPNQDYDDISEDIIDFSILVSGGCY
jgi:hypothetical protein